jgi:hypothetical protein
MRAGAISLVVTDLAHFFRQWRKILALMAELYFRCWHKGGRRGWELHRDMGEGRLLRDCLMRKIFCWKPCYKFRTFFMCADGFQIVLYVVRQIKNKVFLLVAKPLQRLKSWDFEHENTYKMSPRIQPPSFVICYSFFLRQLTPLQY